MGEILVIIIKGIGMLLLAYGALRQSAYGYRMYRDGHGNKPDELGISNDKLKFRARTSGSVVIGTAVLWVWAAVWIAPSYENGPIRVSRSGYEFKAPVMEIRPTASLASVMSDPKALQSYLRKAIVEENANRDSTLELNGQPAQYVADSISVNAVGNGTYLLKARVKAAWSLGEVSFAVEGHNDKITFRPRHLSWLVSPNNDPNSMRPAGNGESSSSTPEPLPLPGSDKKSDGTKPAPLPMPSESGESNAPKPSPLPFRQ